MRLNFGIGLMLSVFFVSSSAGLAAAAVQEQGSACSLTTEMGTTVEGLCVTGPDGSVRFSSPSSRNLAPSTSGKQVSSKGMTTVAGQSHEGAIQNSLIPIPGQPQGN